jgi:hypothetical protein
LTIAATELPGSPKDILVDWQRSDQDNLLIKWSAPETEPASLITGYLLEIDDGNGGQFALAYDGSHDNNNLEALDEFGEAVFDALGQQESFAHE